MSLTNRRTILTATRTRLRIGLWIFAAAFASSLWAQDAQTLLPCNIQTLMKRGLGYRVAASGLIYINCDDTSLVRFETAGRLRTEGGQSAIEGLEVSARLVKPGQPWIRVDLKMAGGKRALDPGREYELDLAPNGQATIERMVNGDRSKLAGPFRTATFRISTRAAARIVPSSYRQRSGSVFRVVSPVALCDSGGGVRLAEVDSAGAKTLLETAAMPPRGFALPKCGSPGSADAARTESLSEYGELYISPAAGHTGRTTVEVTGIRNIFGEELHLQAPLSLTAGTSKLNPRVPATPGILVTDTAVLEVITAWSGQKPPRMSQVIADWWVQTAHGSSHSSLAFNPDGIASLVGLLKKKFPNAPTLDRPDLATGGAIETVEDLVEALNEPI
jgi:hypothetical protein